VKRRLGFSGFIGNVTLGSAAVMMLSAQAAQAAATQIKDVKVNPAGSGI
jgi:hypothetical protein